jgi:predicted Ser/Thr protein kinase
VTGPERIGRYRVLAELGRGAMGVVYRGVDPALDRAVAIKVVAVQAGTDPASVSELEARFLREARFAARLSHPNVVTVYDAGKDEGVLFTVMELVDGESLADRIGRREFPTSAEALELVAQVADALHAAHALGVVHRDIKPGNIMITAAGQVKVADFGIAKAIGEDTGLTRSGTVVGSPAYMAPEQVRGEKLDGRADLFSLGVVLYELLVRRKPFPADTVTTLIYQILHEDPLASAELSRSLGSDVSGLLRRCLAKRLEERMPTAASFAAEARRLARAAVAGEGDATSPTGKILVQAEDEEPPQAGIPDAAPAEPAAKTPPATRARPGSAFEPIAVALGIGLILVAGGLALRRCGGPSRAPAAPVAISAEPTSPPPPHRVDWVAPTAAPAPATMPGAKELPTVVPQPTRPPIEAVFRCRRGAEFNVSPEEALVTVDGEAIGKADDWDNKGGGKTYFFTKPGRHLVELSLTGYATVWIEIRVEPGADDEIADIDTKLSES